MFTLKIHTVDFHQPLHTTFTSTTTSSAAAAHPNNNPKPVEQMGVAHLFRQLPSASHPAVTVASVIARTTVLFVVVVPNYLSPNDFLVFCGNHVPYFEKIIFLKNDGMEDRYSVLIRLDGQLAADGFYCSYSGKRFKPPEQQIWDYVGDRYVHRLNHSKVGGKSVIVNSRCSSVEECGTCGYDEEEGLDGALFSSKIEGILDEYNRLLASQLDTQRQHYESLLAEAKSRKETSTAKAVEKAIFSRTHDLQYKLEKYAEEKKAVADRNQELMKKQEFLRNKFKEIEEREKSRLKSKDERIIDLQEQIRDLKVYVEAQRMVTNMADSDGIRGGTILPVESNQSSGSGNSKRRTKSGREGIKV
ncbi:hypothetical protein DH2020_045034 [Rehmannia glutinosa]|uniref:BRCA1-associated 2/ETP1 RRM domain-containing protein n=1 Tax=Rehmannia glutinosa TaxID=99300 RepID=A0ABR0UFH2_REHGL